MPRTILISCLFLSATIKFAFAHEHAPRVLSPHNADAYSMKTFAQFHRWRDVSGDTKVYEIFKYLTDTRTGLYPLGGAAYEGKETMYDLGAIRDPVKMINVYTIGHCGTLGPTMAGIMEDMGVGPARTLILPGWGHVVSEVNYGGKWHYLDLDVRAIFRRDDGSIASMEEAKHDASLWNRPNGPTFFPLDQLAGVQKAYATTPIEYRYGASSGGHTMDYILRQGETFTRWWKPQGGRWNHHASYGEKPFPRKIIEQEPRGPKCKHASFTIHTHGNGRFDYKPNLTSRSTDYQDGVYDQQNVEPGPNGLALQKGGEGYAVFEVRTPYVIVPLVGDLDSKSDDREASIVRVDATGVALSISLDNGMTWRDVDAPNGVADLTPLVSGTYGYLLKLALKGEPGQSVVRSMCITTWVQLHPASLPSLRKGENVMEYLCGDHHNLPTHVIELRTDGGDRDDFVKFLVQPPADFDSSRKTCRAIGPFVARLHAPSGSKIVWFSAGGSFVTYQGADGTRTNNSMAYAFDPSGDYKTIYHSRIPTNQNHWHYNADVEVKLDQAVRDVYIKYVGDPGVNNIRIYGHLVRDEPCMSCPVEITHAWREKGVLKTKTVKLSNAGSYMIEANEDPVDEYVTLSLSSQMR